MDIIKDLDKSAAPYYMGMRSMNVEKERYCVIVQNYIEYYHRRARLYKVWYLALSVIKFLALAVIPVVQATELAADAPWIAAVASSACLFLESVMELFHMKDKWNLYRKTESRLVSEERQFKTRTGIYRHIEDVDLFYAFVGNIESIIDSEGAEWDRMVQKIKERTGGDDGCR